MSDGAPLPIAVLTGFLGAGKTTLLNFLLRHPAMSGTAVVINEYGDVGLDHHLVQAAPEDVELVEGGCLCCTVRGRLSSALLHLVNRSRDGALPPIRRIIIETTGVAEPGPIVQELLNVPELAERFSLSGVTTVVDAVNLMHSLDTLALARAQVAAADQLLISKIDLVEAGTLPTLEARLRTLNPDAPTAALHHGGARPDQLFGTRRDATATPTLRWMSAAPAVHFRPLSDDTPTPADDAIDSFSVIVDQPLPEWRLMGWLSFLRGLAGPDLLRVKGLLNIEGRDTPLAIHAVQSVFHEPQTLDAWPDADRRSRLVFITQGWGRETVTSTLNYLLGDPA